MTTRPTIKVFERHRVPAPIGSPVVYNQGEGFFVDVSWETELRVGEDLNEGVRRALTELQVRIAGNVGTEPSISTDIPVDSMDERLRKILGKGGKP